MATRQALCALLLLSSLHASLVLAQTRYASPATPTVPIPNASSWLTTTKPGATLGTADVYPSTYNSSNNLPSYFHDAKIAHALLGVFAFFIIFPAGGIIIKVWPHRHIVWIHAAIQMTGLIFYLACMVLGLIMGSRLHTLGRYHAVTGYVVLSFLVIQPLLKLHWFSSAIPRVAIFMHIHLWLGRIALTLGIIDGALGFRVSDSLKGSHWGVGWRIAYGVIGALVWIIYVSVCIVWVQSKKVPRAAPPSPGAPPVEVLALANAPDMRSESVERLTGTETVVMASDVESGKGLPVVVTERRASRAHWI